MAISLLFKELIYFVYVSYVYMYICACVHAMARAEDNLQESVSLSIMSVLGVKLKSSSKCLYLLKHP